MGFCGVSHVEEVISSKPASLAGCLVISLTASCLRMSRNDKATPINFRHTSEAGETDTKFLMCTALYLILFNNSTFWMRCRKSFRFVTHPEDHYFEICLHVTSGQPLTTFWTRRKLGIPAVLRRVRRRSAIVPSRTRRAVILRRRRSDYTENRPHPMEEEP